MYYRLYLTGSGCRCIFTDNINFVLAVNSLSTFSWRVCYWCVPHQKSSLMFKRLDASTLPEDILSETQTLPMMAHSAGSALWVFALLQICLLCLLFQSPLFIYLFSLPLYRTRGGFVALSPISPQELFLQPISSDIEASQPENPVREDHHHYHYQLLPQWSVALFLDWHNLYKHCLLLQVVHVLWPFHGFPIMDISRFNKLISVVYIHQ